MESLVTELVLSYQLPGSGCGDPPFLGILTFGTDVSRSSRSLRCARTPVPPPPLDAKTFVSLHRVRVGAPLLSRDRRRCRFVEQTLRAAALRAAPTPLPWHPAFLLARYTSAVGLPESSPSSWH